MQAPAGARCATHPEVLAAAICHRCGSFACPGCLTATGLCVRCVATPRPLASRGLRFLANVVDTMVVFAPTVVALVGVGVMAAVVEGDRPLGDDASALVGLLGVLATLLGLAAGAGVQVLMQVKYGQSVGKRLFKMRVVRLDGGPVEVWRLVLLRNVVPHLASQLCGLIGLVDAAFIFSAEQRCLHDLIADTIVVDVSLDG